MLPQTHAMIAGVIYDDIVKDHNIQLNKSQLIFGSIKPDIYSGLPKLKHFKPQSFPVICREISRLSQSPVAGNSPALSDLSQNIGIVTHYVADYFCLPHNDRLTYKNHLISHFKYENDLHRVFLGSHLTPNQIMPVTGLDFSSPQQVMNYLDELHGLYETTTNGLIGDLVSSLQATRAVASMIIRHTFAGGNLLYTAA